MVELRFLVPAVGGSNPSVPAIKIERPEPITAQGAFLWASGEIRTRKESTYIRQTPQARKDQERLTSRKYQPSSEKRAACDNQVAGVPTLPGPNALVVQHAVEASRVAIPIVCGHQDLLRNAPAFT